MIMAISVPGQDISALGVIPTGSTTSRSLGDWLGGAVSYLGLVAASTYLPDTFSSTNKQIMTRTKHRARDNITSLQLMFGNWYVNGAGAETGTGATATITASVEYPVGIFTQVKFSGSASGSIADAATLVSDAVAVVIADGAEFWVRSFYTNTAGVVYRTTWSSTLLGGAEVAASGLTDKTMSGTVAATTSGYTPLAILGTTRKPSIAIVDADSRPAGNSDTMDSTLDVGNLERSLGPYFAIANLARSGDRAYFFVASHALRVAVAQYASHIILQSGINDIAVGRTAAQLKADLEAAISYFPGKPVFVVVPEPSTTGTFTSAGGQTVTANESVRITHVANVRAGLAGAAGYLDLLSVVEDPAATGKWRSDGGIAITDGIHENSVGAKLIRDSGIVDPARFTSSVANPLKRFATPTDAAVGTAANLILTPQSAQALGFPAKVASTTDNAIVRFDGTAGLQQNSSATVDDAGGITSPSNITGNQFLVGSFSATGATAGVNIASSARINMSVAVSTAATVQSFYNTNGQVGSIFTNGTATAFSTSSDETLKDFIGEYDPQEAIRIIKADPVRDFHWKASGDYAVGWGAQTSYKVSADLAVPGRGWVNADTGEKSRKGAENAVYEPWGVDQSKRTPYLWAAVSDLLDRVAALEAKLAKKR